MRRMLAGSLLGPPPRESMVPIGPFVLRSLINHSTVGRSGCLKIVCSLDVNYSDDMPIRADSVDAIMSHCSRSRNPEGDWRLKPCGVPLPEQTSACRRGTIVDSPSHLVVLAWVRPRMVRETPYAAARSRSCARRFGPMRRGYRRTELFGK